MKPPSTALEENEELVVLMTKYIYDKCQPPSREPNYVHFYEFVRVAASCCGRTTSRTAVQFMHMLT